MQLTKLLPNLPLELAEAIENEFARLNEGLLKEDWSSLQLHAGRLAEAFVRVVEWHATGNFTPLDGQSKPVRSRVFSKAVQDTALDRSMRIGIPHAIELILDIRNNRNTAHLGGIDPNQIDSATVLQLSKWVIGELIRIERGRLDVARVQRAVDMLSERHISLVHKIGKRRIILSAEMSARDRVLVLLYQVGEPVDEETLRGWAEYGNSTRWQKQILASLRRGRLIAIEGSEVHLLPPGQKVAEKVIADTIV